MREMGGEAPHEVRTVVTVDERASGAQRDALVQLVRELSGGLIADVVRVDVAPVRLRPLRPTLKSPLLMHWRSRSTRK